jgi:hypothetical protein
LHPLAIEKKVSGLRSRIPKRRMKKQDAAR